MSYDATANGVSEFELSFTESLSSQQYKTTITINSSNCNPSTSISTAASTLSLSKKLGKLEREAVPAMTIDGTCPLTYTLISSWPASVAFYDPGFMNFDTTGINDPSSSYLGSSTHKLKIEDSANSGLTPIEIIINL